MLLFFLIRTPSTAGSSDVSFFSEPQENSYTSSGFPTENPSSLRASESAVRPTKEHSPGGKLHESARRPLREESPGFKLNESAHCPVQKAGGSPGYKLNESMRRRVQEAEESPGYKLNESSHHPVQEEHPRDPLDVSTLSRAVQEECPTDKLHLSSTSPVQEESPKSESKESLHHPVQEEQPTDSSDVSSLSHPVQEECPTDKSSMGKSNAYNGEPAVERVGPAKHTDPVRDSSSEEAIAPSDAVEAGEHSRTAIDPGPCDKA